MTPSLPFLFLYHYGIKVTVLYRVDPCRLHRSSINRISDFQIQGFMQGEGT